MGIRPLAQSVERILGKEKPGPILSSGDQQEQPFVQVNAHHSVWIKWRDWQQVAPAGEQC
jgi:hypothetical protein